MGRILHTLIGMSRILHTPIGMGRILHTLIGMGRILHTLVGMGSAALAGAVPYPGKATRISHKGQRSTKEMFISLLHFVELNCDCNFILVS